MPHRTTHDTETDFQSPSWVSQVGVAWALDEAPCPPDLLATLIAIARRAGADGKGSWQSAKTIAAKVGKSEKRVRVEIGLLREAGLIVEGDQSIIPSTVRAGQRPVVYDLALWSKGPKPTKAPRNPGGKNTPGTPPLERTPPLEGRGDLEGRGTPPLEAPPTPPLGRDQISLEEELEESLSQGPGRTSGNLDVENDVQEREREPAPQKTNPQTPGHVALASRGIVGAEADRMVPIMEARNNVRTPRAWWPFVAGNGTLDAVIADARAFVSSVTTPTDPQDPEQLAYAQALAAGPECPHGEPGGAIIRPKFGTPGCAQCRRVAAATERTSA